MRKLYFYIFCFFLGLILQFSLHSQQMPSAEVRTVFTDNEQKRVEKSESLYQLGKKNMELAISFFEALPPYRLDSANAIYERKYQEALEKLKIASKQFDLSTRMLSNVYFDKIEDFWKLYNIRKGYSYAVSKAIAMEKAARENLQASGALRNQIEDANSFEFSLKLHNIARHYEVYALNYSVRSLSRYQDYPVVFDYNWTEKFEIDQVTSLKLSGTKKNEYLPPLKLSLVDNISVTRAPLPKEEEDIVANNIIADKTKYNFQFYIQIAAHSEPINSQKMPSIYKGSRKYFEKYEDGWYKYQIGPFKKYSDVANTLSEIQVVNAFIVVYNSGVRFNNVLLAKQIAP